MHCLFFIDYPFRFNNSQPYQLSKNPIRFSSNTVCLPIFDSYFFSGEHYRNKLFFIHHFEHTAKVKSRTITLLRSLGNTQIHTTNKRTNNNNYTYTHKKRNACPLQLYTTPFNCQKKTNFVQFHLASFEIQEFIFLKISFFLHT